jgi:hypothetical protein
MDLTEYLIEKAGTGERRACLNPLTDEQDRGKSFLYRTMKSLMDERIYQVILKKRHKTRSKKNTLWNKKERNGKVICFK